MQDDIVKTIYDDDGDNVDDDIDDDDDNHDGGVENDDTAVMLRMLMFMTPQLWKCLKFPRRYII